MTRDPPTEFERELNDRVNGGGCTEAWSATSGLRDGPTDGRDGSADESTDRNGGDDLARRAVLGGIGTTAATAGFAGTAAGVDDSPTLSQRRRMAEAWRELPRRYAELDVREILASASTDVLNRLSAEGYIAEPSLAAFGEHPDAAVRGAEFVEKDVLMAVSWEAVRERPVAELFAHVATDRGAIRLSHSPSLDLDPVATVYEDGTRTARVTGDGSLHDIAPRRAAVSTSDCRLCYKTCDPYPEIRGEDNPGSLCGGCDPGVDCGGGW